MVTDASLRQATFDTRAFQNASGQFDRATFEAVLRNNGYTEQHYLDLLRTDIGQRQLVEAVRAGGSVPNVLTSQIYAFRARRASPTWSTCRSPLRCSRPRRRRTSSNANTTTT